MGYNYRMNEISASLGLSQLKKLDYFISKRNELVNEYNKNLPEEIYKPLRDKKIFVAIISSILVPDDLRFNRDDLYNFMHDNGLGSKFIIFLFIDIIFIVKWFSKFFTF